MSFSVNDFIDQLVESPLTTTDDNPVHDMAFEDAAEFFGAKGLRYELEERAAILQHDGGLDRGAAEKQAVREMFVRDFPDV